MPSSHPWCALEARRRAVYGCIAEPAYGHVLETFQFGWRTFPKSLTRYTRTWSPYLTPHDLHIAVCLDDPWPTGVLDTLANDHYITKLDSAWMREILCHAQRILEIKVPNSRPHLMAFLAQNDTLRYAGRTNEVATAWALQFARDQLLKVELTRMNLDEDTYPWNEPPNPLAPTVFIAP